MIHTGDCVDVMATFDAESFDAIVTDPPYGLGFMGKAWDSPGAFVERKARRAADGFDGVGGNHHPTSSADVGRTRLSESTKAQAWHRQWAEAAFRVAKPSAYLLAFGGTRTVHRMTSAIEDAGWIIRDMLVWGYASGFPKSKASLKPAWEPIVMARKPGPLRALAIDGCRLPTNGEVVSLPQSTAEGRSASSYNLAPDTERLQQAQRESVERTNTLGRWPANVILTDPIFDGGIEGVAAGGWTESTSAVGAWAPRGAFPIDNPTPTIYGDSGTYSRFFLITKAARGEREPAIAGQLEEREVLIGAAGHKLNPMTGKAVVDIPRENTHPTVKPLELMRHLVRLVTPPRGVVLDPFLGSGTTALAAEMEGFGWVGIEKEAEYVAIAEARLNGTQRGLGLVR